MSLDTSFPYLEGLLEKLARKERQNLIIWNKTKAKNRLETVFAMIQIIHSPVSEVYYL